ncbi:MAG: AgmX/PglI C-terminal domain-containing protein [Bdellovibrionia bacterium]
MNGMLVLENKKGQVVRSFQWNGSSLAVVYRQDTRRVEAVTNTSELEDAGIPFTLLTEVKRDTIQKRSQAVGSIGTLRWQNEIANTVRNVKLEEEDDKPLITSFKWTAGIEVAVVLLCLLIGWFMGAKKPEPEMTVVQVFERPPAPIVEPITRKQAPKPVLAHAKRVAKPRNIPLKVTRKSPPQQAKKTVALNQMGALGVLGQMNKNLPAGGGLTINAAQSSRGPGLGGNAGSGGVQTSLYSRGLVANPLGPNGRATGAGGYGTKGKGGGQAGYGSLSLVGSSSAYFQPLEREALIEGGLDRDQINEVIQRHLGEVRFCYEQGLQAQPELSGRVAVRFLINGGGVVASANVSRTSLRSDPVEACILQRLKSWKFPEPRGGVNVKVTYPFLLKRTSQG